MHSIAIFSAIIAATSKFRIEDKNDETQYVAIVHEMNPRVVLDPESMKFVSFDTLNLRKYGFKRIFRKNLADEGGFVFNLLKNSDGFFGLQPGQSIGTQVGINENAVVEIVALGSNLVRVIFSTLCLKAEEGPLKVAGCPGFGDKDKSGGLFDFTMHAIVDPQTAEMCSKVQKQLAAEKASVGDGFTESFNAESDDKDSDSSNDVPGEKAPTDNVDVSEDKLKQKIDDKINDRIDDKINKDINKKMNNKINDKINKKLDERINDEIKDKIEDRIDEKLEKKIDDKVSKTIDDKIESKILKNIEKRNRKNKDDGLNSRDINRDDSSLNDVDTDDLAAEPAKKHRKKRKRSSKVPRKTKRRKRKTPSRNKNRKAEIEDTESTSSYENNKKPTSRPSKRHRKGRKNDRNKPKNKTHKKRRKQSRSENYGDEQTCSNSEDSLCDQDVGIANSEMFKSTNTANSLLSYQNSPDSLNCDF